MSLQMALSLPVRREIGPTRRQKKSFVFLVLASGRSSHTDVAARVGAGIGDLHFSAEVDCSTADFRGERTVHVLAVRVGQRDRTVRNLNLVGRATVLSPPATNVGRLAVQSAVCGEVVLKDDGCVGPTHENDEEAEKPIAFH